MVTSSEQVPLRETIDNLHELRDITVLHVDDEPDFADLVSIYLEREGDSLEVLTETSGKAGLDRLDTDDIDCIVSDYDMPRMDGLEFLQAVREDYPDLPFILFTGKGSEEIASDAISAGVTDYLQKGSGTDQYTVLANRIENAVHQYRAAQEVERGFHALETAREGVSFLDEEGTFLYVNPAYADTYGYDREELVGEHWETIYYDEHVSQVHEKILPAATEAGTWTGESIHRHKDGTRLVVDHALTYCSEGTLLCLIQDITEEKETERALERERQRFEQFVDAVEEYAIFALDPNGFITSWNRGAEQLKGYSQEDIIGQHFSVFYPEKKAEAGYPDELLDIALADGSVEDEGWRVRQDGSEFWANVVITAVFDEEGTHQGFLKVTREMTDQRQSETTSEDISTDVDNQLLEQALNQAPVGITISGPPAEDVPLIYVSESFTDLTGYSRDEALGRNCRFLQGEDTSADPVRTMREAIDTRESASVELLNYRKDGTDFWNQVKIAPIQDETGTVTNYVGFQQDVTERKRKERQLERQLAQFEHFGDVVSHDLRTPLETVRGRVELARETGDIDHLQQAETALGRLDALIDDLANVMREGELVTDVRSVALDEVVRSVWETLETADATLTIDVQTSIQADEEALTRLVENLFKNALEHSGADVSVTVGVLADGFYVADDGPGIPVDERDRVFEAGYSTKPEGHGFGLASVRHLAVAHGWNISVTEGSDGGARFELTDIRIE